MPIPIFKTSAFRLWPLLLLAFSLAQSPEAANLSREQRISEGLEAALTAGNAVWLVAGSVRFLALHMESAAPLRYGGAILLHDSDAHADWHEVINPLRTDLAKRGWDTLSIQVPLSDDPSDPAISDPLVASSTPRIQAALKFLNDRGVDRVVLIGHGMGARMAINFITQPGNKIKALVAIGLTLTTENDKDPIFQAIRNTRVPILDINGSRDLPGVLDSAPQRRAMAIRNDWFQYRLDQVSGADHLFSGMQEELTARVAAWLRKTATSQRPSTP